MDTITSKREAPANTERSHQVVAFDSTVTSFLAVETNVTESDPPIPVARTVEVLREFEGLVQKSVIQTLWMLPLGELCQQLRSRQLRIVRSPWLVREALATDKEHIRDLMQEVALAMVLAIRRGAIRAARPVVYTWVRQVAYRITCEKSRGAALALLTGVSLSDAVDDDDPNPPEAGPTAGVTGRQLGEAENADDIIDNLRQLDHLLTEVIPANLTDGQELVFIRRIQGASHQEIAQELGISEGAVRLRLMHARRKLAA